MKQYRSALCYTKMSHNFFCRDINVNISIICKLQNVYDRDQSFPSNVSDNIVSDLKLHGMLNINNNVKI